MMHTKTMKVSTAPSGALKFIAAKTSKSFHDSMCPSGLKSQSKRALSTPPRPPSRRGRVMSDKLTASSGVDPSAKTISVPVFHLYHKLLPGDTESKPRREAQQSDFSTKPNPCPVPACRSAPPTRDDPGSAADTPL